MKFTISRATMQKSARRMTYAARRCAEESTGMPNRTALSTCHPPLRREPIKDVVLKDVAVEHQGDARVTIASVIP